MMRSAGALTPKSSSGYWICFRARTGTRKFRPKLLVRFSQLQTQEQKFAVKLVFASRHSGHSLTVRLTKTEAYFANTIAKSSYAVSLEKLALVSRIELKKQ